MSNAAYEIATPTTPITARMMKIVVYPAFPFLSSNVPKSVGRMKSVAQLIIEATPITVPIICGLMWSSLMTEYLMPYIDIAIAAGISVNQLAKVGLIVLGSMMITM